MTTVCVTIATVIGIYCYGDAAPIGDCSLVGEILFCEAEPDDFQIRPSWYDPFIETDNQNVKNIQCVEPCHQLGDTTPVMESYGLYVACVPGWYGRWIEIDGMGPRQCRDSGGNIVPTYGRTFSSRYGEVWTWWLPIDELAKEQPSYAYDLMSWGFVDG